MKRVNLTQLMAATLVVFSASSIAFAQPPASGADSTNSVGKSHAQCQAKRAEMRQKFAKELGLSADQQKKIDALRSDFYKAHKSEFDAKRAQFQELRTMKQNGATEDQMKAKRDALHQQFAGMKAERQKLNEQIKAVLTPDQVQKFDAMKARHHKHWDKSRSQAG